MPYHLLRSLCLGAGLATVALAQVPVTTDDRTVRTSDDPRIVREDGQIVRDVRDIKAADRNFIERAFRANQDEVAVSTIAAERTSNPNVRQLAQSIVADHEAARAELSALAASRHVTLPAKDNAPNKWAKHDAKSFDRDYLDEMIDHHEETVRLYEKQARNGDDPAAVLYARRQLPRLQEHLYRAIDLKRAMK